MSKPRRFSSRHVPSTAEELVQSQVLGTDVVNRFNGLMRHLKNNTEHDEQTKQVMVSTMEALVPEEYDETIKIEFERRCAYGERMNTEFMTSAKWVKVLREIGAINAPDVPPRAGAVDLAEADIVFHKVIHDCDYGGRRLTYELFCKALYLVARIIRSDLDSESAFAELLSRIVANAPEEDVRQDQRDLMLDANVLLVLDHYKPALYDLFRTFCSRHLTSPGDASRGAGTVRITERTYWKHTQDTDLSGYTGMLTTTKSRSQAPRSTSQDSGMRREAGGGVMPGLGNLQPSFEAPVVTRMSLGEFSDQQQRSDLSPKRSALGIGGPIEEGSPTACDEAGGSIAINLEKAVESEATMQAGADAGGGCAESRPAPVETPQSQLSARQLAGYPSPGGGTLSGTMSGTLAADRTVGGSSVGVASMQTNYVNGVPQIADRKRHMSYDQMMALCKDLKVVPDLLTRVELGNIFKKAQCAGSSSSHGTSLHGYLSKEAFVEAAGQMAIEAYSKSPYSEEYPSAHEKIIAFFHTVLPSSAREVRERFHYGCSGRGR